MPASRTTKKKGARKGSKKARVPHTLPDGSLTVSVPTHQIERVGGPSPSPPLNLAPDLSTLTSSSDHHINNGVTLASAMANFQAAPTGSRTGILLVAAATDPGPGGLTVNARALSRAASGQLSVNEYMAIIHLQQRKIYRLTNESLEGQMGRSQYPISKPVIEDGSEYRIPCTRLVLGLKYYDDARGTINRHIWNEMQSTARAVIASARLLNTLNDGLNYKKLKTNRKNELRGQLKDLFIKSTLIREVLFVNGNLSQPKFMEEWPLDKMLITATASERTTFNKKKAHMEDLEETLLKFRIDHEGRASWLGREQQLVKKVAGATRGRPSLQAYNADDSDSGEEENDDDDGLNEGEEEQATSSLSPS
ncbi:hypothetical protein QFC22_006007 [Naganishia vaughanmartiniae]|uniref:Uncharacterized protein n=1 Tax=Naganishia vaughanmartiniae TaxID=1424756 RepID=A0ACC2WQE7_9TREE|nr:hypothetical protein QFC22_006007 [Naganishia vaughanmartiniae]